MQVDDYLKVFNVIPSTVCQELIKEYDSDPEWQQHKWYTAADDTKSSLHNKELDVLYHKKLTVLEQYLAQALMGYYNETGLKDLVTYHGPIRLNKYKTGTVMSQHFDLIRRNKNDGIPVLTFLGLMNEDFEGGEFVVRDKVVEFKQGDIMNFPSTFIYPHRVEEITKGTRYSFVAWAY